VGLFQIRNLPHPLSGPLPLKHQEMEDEDENEEEEELMVHGEFMVS
jgi:hypothetical protein